MTQRDSKRGNASTGELEWEEAGSQICGWIPGHSAEGRHLMTEPRRRPILKILKKFLKN